MWQSAHETYLESRVLTANPIELVSLLYQGAAAAVGDARAYLSSGDIAARSRSISKACDILVELEKALRHEVDSAYSTRLARLYEYIRHLLLTANVRQEDAPLAEGLGLLRTLSEGWAGVSAQAEPTASPWAQAPVAEPAATHTAQSWSF